MNAKEAAALLELLLDGVDPATGEVLPEGHVCHEPAVLRVLHRAVMALQAQETGAAVAPPEGVPVAQKPERRKTAGAERAGKTWSQVEDAQVWDLWRKGASQEEIARLLCRKPRAIHRRLERLGLLEEEREEDEPPLLPPWTLADVKRLVELHERGCTIGEIAAQMGRAPESIRARLFCMGLSKDSPISLRT